MTFVPGVEPAGASTKEPLYFVVHRRGVVVTREGGGLRLLRAAEAKGVRAAVPQRRDACCADISGLSQLMGYVLPWK